jgi:hypothetical protein
MYRVDGCRGKWTCIRGGWHVWKVEVSIPNTTLKYSTLFLTLLLTWCELDFSFSTFVRHHPLPSLDFILFRYPNLLHHLLHFIQTPK